MIITKVPNTCNMKESMDLFGKALLAYSKGSKEKFYFVDEQGVMFDHPLDFYFRPYALFTRLEKKIINVSYGEILDVGCGTGNITQYLAAKGKVTGIDISPTTIALAKVLSKKNPTAIAIIKKNIKQNTKQNDVQYAVADIFSYTPAKKFDTILLMENNLGMGQTLHGVKNLLRLLSSMLQKDGQILTNSRIISHDYYEARLSSVYGTDHSPFFGWVSFNEEYFKKVCDEVGLRANVLMRNKNTCLFRITKK